MHISFPISYVEVSVHETKLDYGSITEREALTFDLIEEPLVLPLCVARGTTVGVKVQCISNVVYLCCYLKLPNFFLVYLHKGQLLFVSDHWSAVSFTHVPQRKPVCVHCYYRHSEPSLTTTMIKFLQDLPHLVVCSSQVVTR